VALPTGIIFRARLRLHYRQAWRWLGMASRPTGAPGRARQQPAASARTASALGVAARPGPAALKPQCASAPSNGFLTGPGPLVLRAHAPPASAAPSPFTFTTLRRRQYEEIGSGAYSKVYKARKRLGIEFVALRKVDKSRQPKLLNEVRALRELRHGNVLALHGWYHTDRHLWMVTEYCAGGDLAALLEHDGCLPEPTVVSLGLDALAALQHVHGRGFLAVNLTPRAFLLNESGLLKLCDLGSSRHICEAAAPPPHELLSAMEPACAPSYVAPELVSPPSSSTFHPIHHPTGGEGAPPPRPCFSHASDFWALGALLHQMYTGMPPFGPPTSLPQRLLAAATQPLPTPPNASEALSGLLRSLLSKEPTQRPSWDALRSDPFWSGCMGGGAAPIPSQPLYEEWVASTTKQRLHARRHAEASAGRQDQGSPEAVYTAEGGGACTPVVGGDGRTKAASAVNTGGVAAKTHGSGARTKAAARVASRVAGAASPPPMRNTEGGGQAAGRRQSSGEDGTSADDGAGYLASTGEALIGRCAAGGEGGGAPVTPLPSNGEGWRTLDGDEEPEDEESEMGGYGLKLDYDVLRYVQLQLQLGGVDPNRTPLLIVPITGPRPNRVFLTRAPRTP